MTSAEASAVPGSVEETLDQVKEAMNHNLGAVRSLMAQRHAEMMEEMGAGGIKELELKTDLDEDLKAAFNAGLTTLAMQIQQLRVLRQIEANTRKPSEAPAPVV